MIIFKDILRAFSWKDNAVLRESKTLNIYQETLQTKENKNY